ncbi:ABC transporter ATP-binding protein [Bauldia sp.]|uniref:ABC transporter ATP-binding protein n=1 Tax=Bauldia sp. TaxID=2575872 RepID=UPI003BAC9DAE
MARVTLDKVQKRFGEVVVIPDLDLVVDDKEFVVLVGPSGCGKTTTLRIVAGLEHASAGIVRIAERDVTTVRPGQRNCSMVFQNYALYPHMTVRQNIGYGMKVRGEAREEIEKRTQDAARILGIGEYLDRRPKQLSGGQRQRVAIGRAIVRNPDVFLFDEPLSNLDAKLRIEMRSEIKRLHRRLENTVIYVTHDQTEAMTMADRVAVMNRGVIEQFADPITLYERPANVFVAGFIGSPAMNFMPGTLVAEDGGLAVRLEDGTDLPVPADRHERYGDHTGQAVTLGLRPEHMAGGNQGPAVATITPEAVEPLGAHTLVVGFVADTKITAQVDAHYPCAPEEPTSVTFDMTQMHVFDRQSGKAL